MSNAFFQLSKSPTLRVGDEQDNLNYDIDLYNDDTFGSGAVEEDWEFEHNQLVELRAPAEKRKNFNSGINIPKARSTSEGINALYGATGLLTPSQLDDDELERSNQQLAASVEELVLNSDQDQDAIDPAIVSLRKQAPHGSIFGNISSSPHLPPFYQTEEKKQFDDDHIAALFARQAVETGDGGNLQNIWSDGRQYHSHFVNNHSAHLVNGHQKTSLPEDVPFQDDAILTAIKDKTPSMNLPSDFSRSSPMVLKAEDLEREMQNASAQRIPSTPYGISIPKSNDAQQSTDRSLPARSVSPVFGSPSPSTMPIGTPPKHVILNMMHQLEQQQKEQRSQSQPQVTGASGIVTHPPMQPLPVLPPARMSVFLNRPPMFNGPRLAGSPAAPNVVWPLPGRPPFPVTQDMIHRLGLRMASPMHSPIGSPRAFHHLPPRVIVSPNVRRPLIQTSGGPRNRMHQQGPGNSYRRSNQPHKFGPGHLHPEHSKFVRMRQQGQSGRQDRHQRSYGRDDVVVIGVPGDPYANIMTPREKDWVIHIQMMALQSDRPEIDDYYYQNYIERRLREGKLNSRGSNTPKRLITPSKPNAENKKYVPVQFNNSLGKLTTSSVYNPRQIIDVIQASGNDEEGSGDTSTDNRQALSKRLVVYKKIEKAFDLVVLIEEQHSSLAAFGETPQRRLADDDVKAKSKALAELIGLHEHVTADASKDAVFQIMKIRKGKKLLTRTMVFFSQNERFLVVLSIFSHLPILIKRDAKDGVLPELYPSISDTISLSDAQQFLEAISKMNVFTLTAAMRDSVGASIVCKLLDRGRELHGSGDHPGVEDWQKFVSNVSDVIVAVANPREGSRHARPSTPSHLLEAFSFDTLEILAHHQQRDDDSLNLLRSSFKSLIAPTPFSSPDDPQVGGPSN